MNTLPHVSLIAAVARNGVIGNDNALLWHEPQDQRHFRRVTLGGPVVMGRKTWDSLPARFRPLPGRRNVVLTRDPQWRVEGAEAVPSWPDALALFAASERVFVIGGAQIYTLALPMAAALVLTEIDAEFDGDTHFPAWDRAQFTLATREPHLSAAGVGYAFATYLRKPPTRPADAAAR